MPRMVPQHTPEQQKEHERRTALAALDIPAMRAWAERYAFPLLGDDRTVLISMHETRVLDKATPPKLRGESVAWLKAEYPESSALRQIERTAARFRGPSYGRKG